MPEVRTVLAHHNGLAAHHHSILGAESAGDDFVFADAVYSQGGSGLGSSRGSGRVHHWRTVKREIVRPHWRAVGTEPCSAGSGAAARRRNRLLGDTRLEHGQVHVVSAVERQVRHALLVHHTAEGAAGRVDKRSFSADNYFLLRQCPYFQGGIHHQFLRDLEDQATLRLAAKAG